MKPQVYLGRLIISGKRFGTSWVAEVDGQKYGVGNHWDSAIRIATNETIRSACVPTSANYERVNA
jgi:hypothetical protein